MVKCYILNLQDIADFILIARICFVNSQLFARLNMPSVSIYKYIYIRSISLRLNNLLIRTATHQPRPPLYTNPRIFARRVWLNILKFHIQFLYTRVHIRSTKFGPQICAYKCLLYIYTIHTHIHNLRLCLEQYNSFYFICHRCRRCSSIIDSNCEIRSNKFEFIHWLYTL